MKLKSLFFALCFGLVGHAFAGNVHLNPNANQPDNIKNTAPKATMRPNMCEVEILNRSYDNIHVYGTFDDGSPISFDIRKCDFWGCDSSHYISLYYGYPSYCHRDMYLTISTFSGRIIYQGVTSVDQLIQIVPFKGLTDKDSVKVEVTRK